MRLPFLLVGDLMIDITAATTEPIHYASDTRAQISVQPGGAAANTAAWLAHLGEEVHLVGALGADALGAMFREAMTNSGVHLHASEIAEYPAGICIVLVDSDGERTMLPDPGANSYLTPAQLPDSLFTAGGHLHLSGYTLLNPATRSDGHAALTRARAAGLTCSLDPASAAPIRANPMAITEILDRIDVLLANADEAAALTGRPDPSDALEVLAQQVGTVVIKCGPAGALAARGQERCQVAALPASVADTTGAGDAFTAGFMPAWLGKAPLSDSVAAGVRQAAQALCRVGAGPGAP